MPALRHPPPTPAGASAQDPLSLTPPARIAHTGYILDLKRADANTPVHIAFMPVAADLASKNKRGSTGPQTSTDPK